MIGKDNNGFTLVEVMISLVCISLLFLMIVTFVSGQHRFTLNLSQNNTFYNQMVSDIEVLDYSNASNIEEVSVSIKIGVKTFEYTLEELEYQDEDGRFTLYNLQVR